MDLQELLARVTELSREELHIARKTGPRRRPLPAIAVMTLMRCAVPLTGSTAMRAFCAVCMTTSSASIGATRAAATPPPDHLPSAAILPCNVSGAHERP
jgi:hypothetical protein